MNEDKDTIVARDVKDPESKLKRYPTKPSMWDQVKEGFEPTATRAMLESVRKRRMGS